CRVQFRTNLADAAYQFHKTRFAESLLNGVVRSVEDWAKLSFHRAGHHASIMHLAAHRKDFALAFNRLVDLTECNARCGCRRPPPPWRPWRRATSPSRSRSLRIFRTTTGWSGAFGDCLRSRPLVAGAAARPTIISWAAVRARGSG